MKCKHIICGMLLAGLLATPVHAAVYSGTAADQAIVNYYSSAGNYSGSVSGITEIAAPGVTLQSMTVDGDLFITSGVNMGEVVLSDVKVTGQTYIRTGSSADVILSADNLNGVIVESSGVRVTVRGGTEIGALTVRGKGVTIRGLPENMRVTVEEDAGGAMINGHSVSVGTVTAGDDVSANEDDFTINVPIISGNGADWYYIDENGQLVIDVSKLPT